jgi:hypothetical protein
MSVNNIEMTISRYTDINKVLANIVEMNLTLEFLRINEDTDYIDISVSSEHSFDIALFEEILQELEWDAFNDYE